MQNSKFINWIYRGEIMSTKDWILLLVPVLLNGVVVFLLQRIFERKQLTLTKKYEYVSVMQQKVDNALTSFTKAIQAVGNDSVQIIWLNQFMSDYSDVYYYYQQNQILFKQLKPHMDELIKLHKQIESNQPKIKNAEPGYEEVVKYMQLLYLRIYELLQSIQSDCVQLKI